MTVYCIGLSLVENIYLYTEHGVGFEKLTILLQILFSLMAHCVHIHAINTGI